MSSSSKVTKKTIITSSATTSSPQQASSTNTSGYGSASRPSRPTSPLTPHKLSRLEEKSELTNLNNRLATYIDIVRNLQNENTNLEHRIRTFEETQTREVSNVRAMYQTEIDECKKLVDELSKEKAKLEIDVKRLLEDKNELQQRFDKLKREKLSADSALSVAEKRVEDLAGQLKHAKSDLGKLQAEVHDLRQENADLKEALKAARQELDQEMISRVELQNMLQSLQEQAAFDRQCYEKQITEIRTRKETEISEVDGRLQAQYDSHLQEELQSMREQFEGEMADRARMMEESYKDKINGLQSQLDRLNDHVEKLQMKLREEQHRSSSSSSQLRDLEQQNREFLARIRDLEEQLASERRYHMDKMAEADAVIRGLQEEKNQLQLDYQELADIKVKLDFEIQAYRQLIETEEIRLNISPGSAKSPLSRSTPSRMTPLRGTKRKRTTLESSETETSSASDFSEKSHATGDVVISEVCPEGKFVKIHNTGNKEITLSGWQIVRVAGSEETNFKFHRSVKMEPDATITIWSSDIGQTHEPPHNLVMKSQRWFVGDNMTTALINIEGEEMAKHERQRTQKYLATSQSHTRESVPVSARRVRQEIHHYQGDPTSTEKCRLM
ncbi:lamin Dm0-like [Bacillus rossius redtenbacheri]|uniref:lamin Dm0-like n=1 Tax=Bacillus rossius redtenbacheri TaxID=93214 RepID=UPI002FDECF70